MTPNDEQRFPKLISDFVDGCGFERPFHLVVIDARGMTNVTRYGLRRMRGLYPRLEIVP